MKIISYSDYLESSRNFWTDEESTCGHRPTPWWGQLNDFWHRDYYHKDNLSECPFCHNRCTVRKIPFRTELFVFECNCGWWGIYYSNDDGNIDFYEHPDNGSYFEEEMYCGIIKRFDSSDKNIPTDFLINEIKSNKKILYNVNPKKMEEIVQSVFSSSFNCEVTHCGKSHDGGIDLYYVNSDSPIAVQVKRRTKHEAIEGVSTVRDFLGAMIINNYKKGIIVSTADHFSIESIKVQNSLLKDNKVELFDLYDFKRFTELVNDSIKIHYSWEDIIDKLIKDKA